jgi:GR25 family glycosyltransferase involved in LPS biosynthesis
VLARRWDPYSPEAAAKLKGVVLGSYMRNLQRNARRTVESKASFENTFAEKIMCAVLGNASPKGLERRSAFFAQMASPEWKELPFTIEYRMGIRGSSSGIKEYMQGAEPITYLKPHSCANIIALLYENVSALRQFVKDSSKEFLLLLEDDVALTRNFGVRLQAAVYTWIMKTRGPHGILRVGYLPMSMNTFKTSKFTTPWSHEKHTHEFTTGIEDIDKDNANVVRSGVTTLAVGSQAVVYTRHAAQELLKILDAPTLLDVQQRLKAIPHPYPSSSWPLPWDHLLYIPCGEMAFVHPPLAIEGDLSGSSIDSTSPVTRWGHASANGFLDESQYFGAPAWKAAYIATLNEENESVGLNV